VIFGSEFHGSLDHILLSDGSGSLQTGLDSSVRAAQETHYVSATEIDQLTLSRGKGIAACKENHMKYTGTLCRQNAEFNHVKAGGYIL
jgi:hypothetical protein